MPLTQIQTGSYAAGSINTADLSANTTAAFAVSLAPKVTTVNVANSSYTVLDDTAVNVGGGYIVVTGSDFQSGAIVLVDTTQATSTTFVNSTTLRAQVPAKSAATYNIYVVNPDGGVGIKLNGVNYSASPTWVTTSPLANVITNTAFTGTLVATGATSYANTTALPTGMTLVGANGYYYGTISVGSDTTYSFTINATDDENQDSLATFNLTAFAELVDTYFNSTVLLLNGNGSNNANNNVFLDSSNNNFAITRAGNATQGTFSPFSPTGWSNYFDGTGDYIRFGTSTNIALGSSDFTFEVWLYLSEYNSNTSVIFDWRSNGEAPTNIPVLTLSGSGVPIFYASVGAGALITGSSAISLNTWAHLAVVRSGSTVTMYLNGTSVGSATSSANLGIENFSINSPMTGATSYGQKGYFSNARIVKGTAVYTSAFTPSTSALTAITNTSLLTCQSNRFVDNSTNAFTITRNGDVRVVNFSPFAPTTAWSTATHGASAYFDGTGDYLTIADNNAFNLSTGENFTFEVWVHPTIAAQRNIFGQVDPSFNNSSLSVYCQLQSLKTLEFGYGYGSSYANFTMNDIIEVDSWTHLAFVRNGNTIYGYVNGKQQTNTLTVSGRTINDSTNNFSIGRNGDYDGGYFNGYLSNFRFVKGTAVYTSNFTPPTAPVTAIANTNLLLNFTNAGINDLTTKNVIETVGDAKVNTSIVKYGTGSMYFDGTGDYLVMRNNPNFEFGTGNFTIEFWVRFPTTGEFFHFYDQRPTSTDGSYPTIRLNSSGNGLEYVSGGTVRISGGSITTGTWYHVAVSRSGTSTKMFLDGNQIGSTYTDSTNYINGTNRPIIGTSGYHVTSYYLNGYIDDLRVTRGVARYTSNFTPPTSELPLK